MFVRPNKKPSEQPSRQGLGDLGFFFDLTTGILTEISTGAPYQYERFPGDRKRNADYFQMLVPPASRQIPHILTHSHLQMQPLAIPDPRQPHCNIYMTPGALEKENLVVLVTGHNTFCGVWAWNVLLKQGFRPGSVYEYVDRCVDRGYGVLVLNPNENICAPDGITETFNSYQGHATAVQGSETPGEHVGYVWSKYIRESKAQKVAFVAYSTSGIAVLDLLKYDYQRFTGLTACIAFIDSLHSTFQLAPGACSWLAEACAQWATSEKPVGTVVQDDRAGCLTFSGGNQTDTKEMTPWTCMEAVLEFIETRFSRGLVTEFEEFADTESLSDSENAADGLEAVENVQVFGAGTEASATTQSGEYSGWEM
ncbi:hypothetical protein GGI07_002788 [Coemansia sp. Benny D115]|nr:hypothetical protein GGI07_002788 [Coemansia sp. Benny D115]